MQDTALTHIRLDHGKRNTMGEQVFDALREQILTAQLKPGDKLSEQRVGEQLQVSRTPVRDAFRRLHDAEMIEVYPQSGTRVALIDVDRARQAIFIRATLESLAFARGRRPTTDEIEELELLVRRHERQLESGSMIDHFRADMQFHAGLMTAIGMTTVWRTVQYCAADMVRVQFLIGPDLAHLRNIVEDHRAVLEALERGDLPEVERRMREHLEASATDLEGLAQSSPDYFTRPAV
ncbi:GntR family transcriptional regulator [Pseudooceanicola sp. CBS1P-1]|uniref:GntR family transcriptional regulator n=1 Tax=Pseudooceanicola albus TaxID=2692189 RepID=A0A6L7G9K9_9RHOB|nr:MULTISPECIES: GntR family transcriptional regulator [Pseudooceanicola]MBT9386303.1 GntR family transcriptional regulator [Pseudooceanicola endophyticus]MXN20352.1 GntR family transcriptional regulator [Pseudooceanicola albus]